MSSVSYRNTGTSRMDWDWRSDETTQNRPITTGEGVMSDRRQFTGGQRGVFPQKNGLGVPEVEDLADPMSSISFRNTGSSRRSDETTQNRPITTDKGVVPDRRQLTGGQSDVFLQENGSGIPHVEDLFDENKLEKTQCGSISQWRSGNYLKWYGRIGLLSTESQFFYLSSKQF